MKIDRLDKLKRIYGVDNYLIEIIINYYKQEKENSDLKKEISELKTHIMASSDGKLYFEAKESWDNSIQTKN